MSGLATFFAPFLATKNDSNEVVYETTLAEALENIKDSEINADNTPEAPTMTESMDWNAWKAEHRRLIATYIKKRIIGSDNDDDSDEEVSSDDDSNKDDDESVVPSDTEDKMETQLKDPTTPLSARKLKAFRRRIPHVLTDTKHRAQHLADVDLYTRDLVMTELCLVVKHWATRPTSRYLHAPAQPHELFSGQHLARLTRKNCVDDGPLSTLYKTVLSLELSVLKEVHAPTLRSLAEQLQQNQGPTVIRTKVFLYGAYADAVENIRCSLDPKTYGKMLVRFAHVPAKCILPYALSDWFDRHDQNDYCICLGDKSKMSLNVDGESTPLEFSDADTVVTIAWVDELGSKGHEVLLTTNAETGVQIETIKNPKSFTLVPRYAHYKRIMDVNAQLSGTKRPAGGATRAQQHDGNEGLEDGNGVPNRHVLNPNSPSPSHDSNGSEAKRARIEQLVDLPYLFSIHASFNQQMNSADPFLVHVLYAAVLAFSCPCKSKGDWNVILQIFDKSIAGDDPRTVKVTNAILFARLKENLPALLYSGDVIRMNNVKVQMWDGETQVVGQTPSSYLVLRGDPNDPDNDAVAWTLASSPNSNDECTDDEMIHMKDLWKWTQQLLFERPSMNPMFCLKISDLPGHGNDDAGRPGDYTCMVAAILPVPHDLAVDSGGSWPCGFLRVWDGTGPPTSDPIPFDHATAHASVANGDPPNEAIARLAKLIRKLHAVSPACAYLEPPKALTGRVANVVVWEKDAWERIVGSVSIGSFVRLRNVRDRVLNKLRCIFVSQKSYVMKLPDLTYETQQLLDNHGQRLLRGDRLNDNSGVLPLSREDLVGNPPAQRDGSLAIIEDDDEDETVVQATFQSGEHSFRSVSLKDLVTRDDPQVFTGTFRIVDTVPKLCDLMTDEFESITYNDENGSTVYNSLALSITDDSLPYRSVQTIDAVVSDTADATTLFGLTSLDFIEHGGGALYSLEQVVHSRSLWSARVRSEIIEGQKYFFLSSLTACE